MVLDLNLLGDADAGSDSHELASSSGAPERRSEKRSPYPPLTPSSASFVPTPTSRGGPFEMTEHQTYQRLRLRLVKLFGSLAAALYEMGADPDTGKLGRKQFEDITCGRLGLLTASEASLLFSHITYMDVVLGTGSGNVATFKDFSVTEEEWRQVVSSKTNIGGASCMPFMSGPSGGSMGMYHRPIRISTVNGESGSCTASQATPINAAWPSSASAGSGATFAPSGQRSERLARQEGNRSMTAREARTQPAPWRRRQKPWIESSLTGDGPSLGAELVVARGRPCEQTMRMAGEGERFMDRPGHSQLGAHARGWCVREGDNSSFLISDCPTRRCEMASRFSPRVGDTWPYDAPKPTPQLRATRARLLALSARG